MKKRPVNALWTKFSRKEQQQKNAVQDLPGKIGRTAENDDEGHETKECVKSVIL